MKIGRAKALWKVPELWKNQKAVFPQLLGPSVHTSHNAGCYWTFLKHNFPSTPEVSGWFGEESVPRSCKQSGSRVVRRRLAKMPKWRIRTKPLGSRCRRKRRRNSSRGRDISFCWLLHPDLVVTDLSMPTMNGLG